MEIEEVVEKWSLKTYLKALPNHNARFVAVAVSYRSALLVCPIALNYLAITQRSGIGDLERSGIRDLAPLPVFGALAVSATAMSNPSGALSIRAANAAANAAYALKHAAQSNPFKNVSHAITAAANAVNTVYASLASDGDTASVAAEAVANAAKANPRTWDLVRMDLTQLRQGKDLLTLRTLPGLLQNVGDKWTTARRALEVDQADWTYWIEWFERAIVGENIHAERLALVLNQMLKRDWLGDPHEVNGRFAEVLELYQAEDFVSANPYGFRAELDPESAVLKLYETDPRDMSMVLDQVLEALSDFDRRCQRGTSSNIGSSAGGALAPEIQELRDKVAGCGVNPKALHWQLRRYIERFEAVLKEQELPVTADTTGLLNDLRRAKDEICVISDVVRADEDKRMAIKIKQNFDEYQLLAIRTCLGMAADGEGQMKTFALLAAKSLADPEASLEEKQAAIQFALRMGVESSLLISQHEADVGEEKSLFRRSLDRFKETSDVAVKGDKLADVMQEAIAEGSPLGQRLLEIFSTTNFGGLM